jgi:hypothetical protein
MVSGSDKGMNLGGNTPGTRDFYRISRVILVAPCKRLWVRLAAGLWAS